jgi:WD40 repeat protein
MLGTHTQRLAAVAAARLPLPCDVLQVHDRTIYSNIHRALVNSIRYASWLPGGFSCASASSDGTVKLFDVETGAR